MKGPSLILMVLLVSRALLPVGAAKIQVVKKNAETIHCELLAVKSNSLTLLLQEGVKLSLPLDHIDFVIIQKKRKYLGNFMIGAVGGGLLYSIATDGNSHQGFSTSFFGSVLVGGLIVTSFSMIGRKSVRYDFVGTSPLEKAEILHKLKKYALVAY